MSFFPLKFKATIQRRTSTTDSWGQEINTWATVATDIKCLFLATSGNKNTVAREQFSTVVAFYVDPGADFEEGDRVLDIKNVAGQIIEPGPFEAVSVKRVGSHISGKVHHISAKLVGAA